MSETAPGFPKLEKQTRWKCKRDDETCTRTKPCRSCLGARNRRKGLRKQRAVAKNVERASGVPVGRFSTQTSNEENWRGPFRVEAKSGAQVKGIASRYLAARAQSDASQAVGDGRPFMFAAIPDGWPDGQFLWILHSEDLPAVIEAVTT